MRFVTGRFWLAFLAAGVGTTACGRSALYKDRTEETVAPRMPGSQFKVLAVIAGNDSRPDLNMSAGVRTMLTDSGWVALPAPGRWETEAEAAGDICGRTTFNAVVIVVYDRITLRACQDPVTHNGIGTMVAYEIQGGAELGLRGMAQKLMVYLRSDPNSPMTPGQYR